MSRITIISDQSYDLEGVQVEREVNGRLERGYVTSYANSLWTIKYVHRVPTSQGFREHVLGKEKVGYVRGRGYQQFFVKLYSIEY